MSEAESEALTLALIWKSERDQAILERNQEREACAMYAERSGRFAEQADTLQRERDEARREADRFRHGCTVEGDFVCPNEYAVSELTAERNFLRALKKNHEEDFTRVCKERDKAQEAYREARASSWHVSRKWDEALKEIERLRTKNEDMGRALNEARAEVEKLSESAKAAWEAECVMREQRDRYHAEWKQERQEVERLRADRDEWRDKFLALNQTAGELCNACGWAFKIPGEPCRCEVVRERDEARAEVDGMRSQIERLRGVLHIVSLDEYESTSSAAEKVHAHARQARVVLNETLADVTPSDAAHVASLENLFLKACKRAEKWETASKDAYRRGAEAMREACAVALMADGLVLSRERAANVVRALPIPEEP